MQTFRLTRYFSLLSFVLIALAGGTIGGFVHQRQSTQLVRMAEDRNVAMTQVFRNALWDDFSPVVAASNGLSAEALRLQSDRRGLQAKAAALMLNSDVIKVKAYNLDGLTVFSSDPRQIGEDKRTNAGFIAAASGKVASELTHRNQFDAFEGQLSEIDVTSSYIPIREQGKVVGVLEVYQDVTVFVRQLDQTKWLVWLTVLVVLAALYLIQLLVVRRAQAILHGQAGELEVVNRDLDRRVQERTAALEQVQQQNLRHETILNTAIDGFFSAELSGRLRNANPAFCAMLGYSEAELLKMSIQQIEAHENGAEAGALFRKVLEQGAGRFDARYQRKEGARVEVEISVRLATIGGEKLFYAFVRDITPRKTLETELRRARDEAERANAAKSEFLSSMSHELRTPMNAVIGFAQLLEYDHRLDVDQKNNVREITHAGHHLMELINKVLDLAQIDSGKLELTLESVSVQSVVADSLALVAPIARAGSIALIDHTGAGQAVRVHADHMRLRQVLINLLSNAIKYNRPQGSVTVSCESIEHVARIRVTDTGPGIPADRLSRMYSAFDRLGRESGPVEGTGIGLVITKQLVEAMAGTIGFESVEGQGCTFWVEFPLSEAA